MYKLLFIAIILSNNLFAQQDWRKKVNDKWFREFAINGLNVGDTMPDIPLGIVANNNTGKTRFSEFKGKLVILDFWNTSCTSCISDFPKMEELQRKFEDHIQIILVNISETQQTIEFNLDKYYKNSIVMPKLPSISANVDFIGTAEENAMANPLYALFPNRGIPHHVWIDKNGIIILRGGGPNTYESKIRDVLTGKQILSLASDSNVPSLGNDPLTPYYRLLGDFKDVKLGYGSFITGYNNELNGSSASFKYKIIDSLTQSIRSTFINCDIYDLYVKVIFREMFLEDWVLNKTIYSADPSYFKFIDISRDIDTILLFSLLNPTDSAIIKAKYCYEQILPISMTDDDRLKYMLSELNRYFSLTLGIVAEIQQKPIPCFVLKRTSNKDKLSSDSTNQRLFLGYSNSDNIIYNDGKKFYKWEGANLKTSFSLMFSWNSRLTKILERNRINGQSYILFNETGWSNYKKINILLPHVDNINSMNDLRYFLKKYDLDIIEVKRLVPFVVFKKVKEFNHN